MKCILQGPEDDNSWPKLEAVRQAVCAVVEGERDVFLHTAEEVESVAAAIEACTSEEYEDEVGGGSKLLPGSRFASPTKTRALLAKPMGCQTSTGAKGRRSHTCEDAHSEYLQGTAA